MVVTKASSIDRSGPSPPAPPAYIHPSMMEAGWGIKSLGPGRDGERSGSCCTTIERKGKKQNRRQAALGGEGRINISRLLFVIARNAVLLPLVDLFVPSQVRDD